TARHRADHPPEAARRFSAQRIPAEARHAGRRDPALRTQGVHREVAYFPRRSGRNPANPDNARRTRGRMTFPDTVRFLYSLGHDLKPVKWDLARIRAVLAEVGDPHRQCRFIHVAGTNGKGSVCAMIASCLQTAGFRTGLYTSPHLVDPRERIQIDG